jgi:hypothetical protein
VICLFLKCAAVNEYPFNIQKENPKDIQLPGFEKYTEKDL